jgi:hypothetical protein
LRNQQELSENLLQRFKYIFIHLQVLMENGPSFEGKVDKKILFGIIETGHPESGFPMIPI